MKPFKLRECFYSNPLLITRNGVYKNLSIDSIELEDEIEDYIFVLLGGIKHKFTLKGKVIKDQDSPLDLFMQEDSDIEDDNGNGSGSGNGLDAIFGHGFC